MQLQLLGVVAGGEEGADQPREHEEGQKLKEAQGRLFKRGLRSRVFSHRSLQLLGTEPFQEVKKCLSSCESMMRGPRRGGETLDPSN